MVGDITPGRRLPDDTDWSSDWKIGDYVKLTDKRSDGKAFWMGKCPNGLLSNLSGHTIVENEDKTITVSPSILINAGNPNAWHGFLENGKWREV